MEDKALPRLMPSNPAIERPSNQSLPSSPRHAHFTFEGCTYSLKWDRFKTFESAATAACLNFGLRYQDAYFTRSGFVIRDLTMNDIDRTSGDLILQVNPRIRGGSNEDEKVDDKSIMKHNFAITPFFLGSDRSPNAWLVLVELSLKNANIVGSKNKFEAWLPTLPAELLTRLSPSFEGLMTNQSPYETLVQCIKDLFSEPKTEIFDRYFKGQSLGSDLPSVFLKRAMDSLEILHAGITTDDALLRRFFLSALPAQTQAILTV